MVDDDGWEMMVDGETDERSGKNKYCKINK